MPQPGYSSEKNREHCRAYRERHKATIRAQKIAKRADPEVRAADNARRKLHHHENRQTANTKRTRNAAIERDQFPWRKLLRSAQDRAKMKGLPFTLTEEWAIETWSGRCSVSGIEFCVGRGSGPKFFSPSIDQITPKAGYTPDNCRFVLWAVNALKHDGTDADMIRVARAIVAMADSSMT